VVHLLHQRRQGFGAPRFFPQPHVIDRRANLCGNRAEEGHVGIGEGDEPSRCNVQDAEGLLFGMQRDDCARVRAMTPAALAHDAGIVDDVGCLQFFPTQQRLAAQALTGRDRRFGRVEQGEVAFGCGQGKLAGQTIQQVDLAAVEGQDSEGFLQRFRERGLFVQRPVHGRGDSIERGQLLHAPLFLGSLP